MDTPLQKKLRLGGIDAYELRSLRPEGPKDLRSFCNWYHAAWTDCMTDHLVDNSEDRLGNLLDNCQRGIYHRDLFTGKGSGVQTFGFWKRKFEQEGINVKHMVTLNACEKKLPGQACLKEFPLDICPLCLHGDLEDRLPEHVRTEILKRDPERMTGPFTISEKLEKYEDMRSYLRSEAHNIYNASISAPCLKHPFRDGGCPLRGNVDANELSSSFQMWTVTPSCSGWTARGLRKGFADPSAKPWHILMIEIRALKPDAICWEEATGCPLQEALDRDIGDIYRNDITTICPSDRGVPKTRPRHCGYSTCRETTNHEIDWSEFRKLFYKSVEMTGDDFFMWPEDMRQEVIKSMAAKRGLHYPADQHVSIFDVLPPGARQKCDDYLDMRMDRQGISGTFIFDVEQNAKRATCGPFFSSFLTHGTIISASLGKLLVSHEHLFVMGEAIFEDLVDPMFMCPFRRLLDKGVTGGLSWADQKYLAGQAVHTHVMGALQFYGLQRITKRKRTVIRMISDSGTANDSDEDL